jgi:leucyl/phenylalanyl-tRNA---protein transferase
MPVFALDEQLIFPHPILREPDGLLAVGGDLSPERILLAYRWGIFPWYHDDQPILWWWLAPRLMVRPQEVHISHSLRNVLNQNRYTVTFDQDFITVMEKCGAVPRKGQHGTWIMPEMIEAYTLLHHLGYAHSVEVRDESGLVGGLYGIALGKIFFGESMFAEKPNASKVGFVHLARHLVTNGFLWIDCQQDTPHMRTLGAHLIEENDFLELLRENQKAIIREQRSSIF